MTGREAYKIWAPAGKPWVDWVRPVPFLAIGRCTKPYVVWNLPLPRLTFLEEQKKKNILEVILGIGEDIDMNSTAIIVDQIGEESVRYGIALGKQGFRPIPIYNGTVEQGKARATVDNQLVIMALEYWAYELEKLDIPEEARPAFLLDRARLNRYKPEDSIYDNSWDVYPQDLPSAQYFIDQGIKNILVVGGGKMSRDLKNILVKHQKKGIAIYHTDGYKKSKRKYIVPKLKWD